MASRRVTGARWRREMGAWKGSFHWVGPPLIDAQGGVAKAVRQWWPWARQSGGGRCPKAVGAAGHRCSDKVTDRWVPRGFTIFRIIQNWLKLVQLKWMPYHTPKIPNFCMRLEWNILNNFLNCFNFTFPTKIKLKILEQIQYLKLHEF
jgi:hypothetical protein